MKIIGFLTATLIASLGFAHGLPTGKFNCDLGYRGNATVEVKNLSGLNFVKMILKPAAGTMGATKTLHFEGPGEMTMFHFEDGERTQLRFGSNNHMVLLDVEGAGYKGCTRAE